ncbi:MAG: serine/threonine protein kinase [Bdellovibrionales bacterium]|nr:serine/threonine protein kinase [Bdellovibrionales bacterium]
MSIPLSNFSHLFPEVIFEAAEILGGRCTGRFLALNAMENRVYDITMEEGDNRIIKFYRPGRWTRPIIEAEHLFLKKSFAAEIPVVCPLELNGETLFEKNGIFFTIFPKRPGRLEPELNDEQLERLGRYLARLHNVGEELKTLPRKTLTPQTYGRDSVKGLIEMNQLPPGNLGFIYQQLVAEICDRSEPFFEGIETCLIHGDCHAGNVLWRGNEPYFIDFDDMLYGPPVQDFWMLIGGDDEYAIKNRDKLIDAYLEIREFDERTLKLIEPLRGLRLIYFSAWIGQRWEDGAFKLAFPHFGTEKYWQEQLEHLSFQLERIKVLEK